MTRRVPRLVLGWTLLALGVAALVLPGPGLLLLAAGLVVLSHQYAWAERRVGPVEAKAHDLARSSVRNRWTITASLVLALGLMALGVVWGLWPPPPGWWPFGDRWWLPGGWATGSSLIGSGLVAIGLLVYSYRRFHGDGGDRAGREERGADRRASGADS
ncbi:hypothetical protein GCM10009809_04850 [Isoptericola hypogeus]|uniref:Transmembrane protein (PGPGW) n=1 Tax=Isoptericola hypogeus TaxID=300179 RepID=A0ABP4UU01_9MICO